VTGSELRENFGQVMPNSAAIANPVSNLVAFATRTTSPEAVPSDFQHLIRRLHR